jgi:outer membrane receptor protein involved in Fe transport
LGEVGPEAPGTGFGIRRHEVSHQVEGHHLVFNFFGRNLTDKRYVPLAFAYPGFTPSGFLAEPGSPRTWGVTLGIRF